MARVVVSRELAHTASQVWEVISDLGSHTRWMRDARSISFTTNQTRGVGTRMNVETVIGPFRTTDVMAVVDWDEGRSIGVVHQGLVTGRGTLEVAPAGAGCLVTWDETLTFPWRLGGGVTAWLARPVLAVVWRSNLKRLEEAVTSR